MARELIALIGAGTNGNGAAVTDQAHLQRLIAEMDRAIAEIRRGQNGLYRGAFQRIGQTTVEGTAGIYSSFGRTTVGRLNAAKDAFVEEARSRIFNPGFSEWVDRFDDASGTLRAGMKRAMIRGQLEGWGQRELANEFLRMPEFNFGNLPKLGEKGERIFTMGGKLTPSDALIRRANVIARTELNGVANQMHMTWTEQAGFTKYININSDPVADVCQAANSAGELTREQWANGLGIPPRHPNCDSGLLAVS